MGAMALYSASQGSWQPWAGRHVTRAALGIVLVVVIAFGDFKLIDGRLMAFWFIDTVSLGC